MDLSIITPAAPKRKPRIASLFNRLQLNAERNPDIKFEFIIVDDSMDQQYKDLATAEHWKFPIKYIHLPLTEPYPNPAYMRNVGFRVAEGRVFTMIDADHWIHEDFILGALEPFRLEPVLNTGFMIDTSKGSNFVHNGNINNELITNSSTMSFDDCMKICGIKGPIAWNKVWLAAYPAEKFLSINGYDEKYVTGYSREDDDIYYRLASVCSGVYNQGFANFAGVHLWHPQTARSDAKNQANRKYYDKAMNSLSTDRNVDHEWGKFVLGATSIIDGVVRGFHSHENYVQNLGRVPGYNTHGNQPWKDFADLQDAVA